jgi:quercetin dioxygenase-like cupin family protein
MQGQHRPATQTRTVDDGWGTLTWLANQQLTSSPGITVGRVVIRKGRSNPRHRHNSCEEVLYLMKGKLRHTVGDEAVVLNPGDTLTVLAGVFHNADSIGDEDADMIVAYSSGSRDFELENPADRKED